MDRFPAGNGPRLVVSWHFDTLPRPGEAGLEISCWCRQALDEARKLEEMVYCCDENMLAIDVTLAIIFCVTIFLFYS